MLGEDFQLLSHQRRIVRAIVDAMVPRWPDFPVELTDAVLGRVEETYRQYPPGVQVGVLLSLYAIELGGPVIGGEGWRPTSWLDREGVTRRLHRIANHRLPAVRMLVLLHKITSSFAAYSRPDVEAFLGCERRTWRTSRVALRERLVEIDAGRRDPATPAPLGTEPDLAPEDVLAFDAAERLFARAAAG